MFTGLVESTGTLRKKQAKPYGIELTIAAPFAHELTEGESVAVNGACLTVATFTNDAFTAYASEETLDKTNLGRVAQQGVVNLERALRFSDRLGGHLMLGHVDGVGQLLRRERRGPGEILTFEIPGDLARYLIPKGSIGLDGMSLTVNTIEGNALSIYAIPHTLAMTTLPHKQPGDPINVEVDMIAKYLERFLLTGDRTGASGKTLWETMAHTGIGKR